MKLYTEEQVVRAMSLAVYNKYEKYMEVLDLLTPIELPSDEEIGLRTSYFKFEKNKQVFYNGAKWVIEQIKQQDNA